jgi:hypothetical protein
MKKTTTAKKTTTTKQTTKPRVASGVKRSELPAAERPTIKGAAPVTAPKAAKVARDPKAPTTCTKCGNDNQARILARGGSRDCRSAAACKRRIAKAKAAAAPAAAVAAKVAVAVKRSAPVARKRR